MFSTGLYIQIISPPKIVILIVLILVVSLNFHGTTDDLNFPEPELKSQDHLVFFLYKSFYIWSAEVGRAMAQVDRVNFLPQAIIDANLTYSNDPYEIGYGSMIMAPYIQAYVLEELDYSLKNASKVLDIGCGSGYLTACMALMVNKTSRVIGIDHIPEMVEQAERNVMKENSELLKSGRLQFVCGDGRLGYPKEAPYDVINVGGSLSEIPKQLVNQLKNGGKMLIPICEERKYEMCKIWTVEKDENGTVTETNIEFLIFPPLLDRETQMAGLNETYE